MSYFNFIPLLNQQLNQKNRLYTDKVPSLHPSSSMCYSAIDNAPLGSCIRSVYLKAKKTPASNPTTNYVKMASEAGLIWEAWLIDKYKQLGIYRGDGIKVYSEKLGLSGEIDVLHINPSTNELEITEVKQYNGSSIYAVRDLKGYGSQLPKPKDQNLLQVFDYLLICKDTISRINLLYIDRSCSSFENIIQFVIELEENKEGIYYPKITYFQGEQTQSYVDVRINSKNVHEKREMVRKLIEVEQLPPRDYHLKYTKDNIEIKLLAGEISKAKYNKYLENPSVNYIGDWNCKYCPYGPGVDGFSVCESLDNED